jgi:hypothetical protein
MPQSAWITHVKNYANENNCSYKEALSKASASYKKQKGEGCCDKLKEWREKNKKKIHPEVKNKSVVAITKKGKAKYFQTDTAEPEVQHQRRDSKISSLTN